MKGLIKKDLLLIISNWKQYLLFVLIFIFFAFNGLDTITYLPILLGAMILISTFSYDNLSNWPSYALTLNMRRKDIVTSKYVENILFSLIISLLTLFIAFLISFIKEVDFGGIILTLLWSFGGVLFLFALAFPLIFKFGVDKGRIFLVIIMFSVTVLIGILLSMLDMPKFLRQHLGEIFIIGGILLYLISYFIAVKIYNNKEF